MHRERLGAGLRGDGLGEAGEHSWVRVVAADEVDEAEHLVQYCGVGRAGGLHALRDVPAQAVGVEVGERHPDDGHRELAARDELVERGQHELAREVAGDAEQHQDIGSSRPGILRCHPTCTSPPVPGSDAAPDGSDHAGLREYPATSQTRLRAVHRSGRLARWRGDHGL